MNPLYFAVDKSGYHLRPAPLQLNANFKKQLPVFRVVSEFMNAKEKGQQVEPINQVEEQIDIPENQFSSRSLNIGKSSKIKYVLLNTGKMMEKQEVNSIDLDSSAHQKIKQKQMSIQDTNASRIRTIIKGNHIKINSANLRNEKTNPRSDLNDKELLYLELQKQQALRRNLQNSYKNLLQKLKNEGFQSLTSQVHYKVGTLKRKFLSLANKESQNLGQNDQKSKNRQQKIVNKAKLRRSCCQLSSSDQGEISLKCQAKPLQDEDPENLQNEMQFRSKLCMQIEFCQERIDEIQNNILKRQKQLQKEAKRLLNLEKENELLKLNEQNLRLKQKKLNLSQESQKNGLGIRYHIHYMFTILIMFFIIAMIAKKHN